MTKILIAHKSHGRPNNLKPRLEQFIKPCLLLSFTSQLGGSEVVLKRSSKTSYNFQITTKRKDQLKY